LNLENKKINDNFVLPNLTKSRAVEAIEKGLQ